MLVGWLLLLGPDGPGFVASPTRRPMYPTCHLIGFPLTRPPVSQLLDAGEGSYRALPGPPEPEAAPLLPCMPVGTLLPVPFVPGSPSAGSCAGRFGAGEGSRACMSFMPSRRRAMFAFI